MALGFGHIIIRSPYTGYSVHLRGAITFWVFVVWDQDAGFSG